MNLSEGILKVLQGGLQHWQFGDWLPVCSTSCSLSCHNLTARILGHADGRGDERQYTLRNNQHIDSSHVFGVTITVPSIHLATVPKTVATVSTVHPPVLDCNIIDCPCGLVYSPSSILSNLRMVEECKINWREWRGRRSIELLWGEEAGIRVWSLPAKLESMFGPLLSTV